jgi:hypothetical protein
MTAPHQIFAVEYLFLIITCRDRILPLSISIHVGDAECLFDLAEKRGGTKPVDRDVSFVSQCQDGIHSDGAFLKDHQRVHIDFLDLIMKIHHQGR